MSRSDRYSDDQTTEDLHRHILAPIVRADNVVAAEREEIRAEMDAFRSFFDRVSELEPTPTTTGTPTSRSLYATDSAATTQRLRTAYEETVLSMEHFERVYDESLAVNVATELSPQLVHGFKPGGGAFTDVYRQVLIEAVGEAVVSRKRFVSVLEEEVTALDKARNRLRGILDRLVWSGRLAIPTDNELERLDDIARERQETLGSHLSLIQYDSHEFCEYIYESEQWTYPVLTAVVRLRKNVME